VHYDTFISTVSSRGIGNYWFTILGNYSI